LTLKGMETSLNLATWPAISSLMFSRSRHLSAVLGGGAARRPAWDQVVPEIAAINAKTVSQSLVFMTSILAACVWRPWSSGKQKIHHGGTETRRNTTLGVSERHLSLFRARSAGYRTKSRPSRNDLPCFLRASVSPW